ncbi:MAG: hypothetical protein AB7K24_30425 [Gemmataceae bacterium]
MRKHRYFVAAALFILAAGSEAQAQNVPRFGQPGANTRPAVSPFIGLGGPNAGLNYLYNVRPQLEIRSLINRQQGEIQDLENRERRIASKRERKPLSQEHFTLPRTGHRVYFSNYSHYFVPPAGQR